MTTPNRLGCQQERAEALTNALADPPDESWRLLPPLEGVGVMGGMQRRKGADGERELIRQLRDFLGEHVRRNLEQARTGGADVLGIEGWAPEVKRAALPRLAQWWTQAVRQADLAGERPVLLYRLDRRPWRAVVALADVVPGFESQPRALEFTLETSVPCFAALARESMVGTKVVGRRDEHGVRIDAMA